MPHASSILPSEAFAAARRAAVERLLAARNPAGHWTGRLTSSALSTATAIAALRLVDRALGADVHAARIAGGATWLVASQLADGSWGDTPASRGNLSTTLLAWAALADTAHGNVPGLSAAVARGADWIDRTAGSRDPAAIARSLAGIYGRDRTFSVPILTHLAACGRLGDPARPDTWRRVPQLPFELAGLPRRWFQYVDMQVVSYALPALIAIGLVRHTRAPAAWPLRLIRDLARPATLRTLAAIQPHTGGYLEATPLTSFVTTSLASMGLAAHAVATRAVEFLAASQRPDGSWPIDTNLATWVTTLSVTALAAGGRLADHLDAEGRAAVRDWLLAQQWRDVHPATGASPGGWAWTDLAGGVPDADDTSGAVLALAALQAGDRGPQRTDVARAATAGLDWLVGLANRDGGIPTFCRGWGRLPFDTSCPDITAHFLRAAAAWPEARTPRRDHAARAARRYLARTRKPDSSWCPLWFGDERHPAQENPVYGTAKVVLSTLDADGADWLIGAMHADGGVGAAADLPPSIEETAVTVEALARVAAESADAGLRSRAAAAVETGVGWLVEHTAGGIRFDAAPIGLYFAKLWYAEDLYPLAFTVAAFERAAAISQHDPRP